MAVSIRAGGICSVTKCHTDNRIYSILRLAYFYFNDHLMLSAVLTVDQICLFFSFRLNTWIIDEQNKIKNRNKCVPLTEFFSIESIFA